MNCERPIQFWVVLPRSAGVTVMLVLVATGWPFTYSVPVWPASVTATCDQVFSGSVPGPAITSPPPLGVASANRSGPPPALSVRNMKLLVPVPKSNTRDQAELADGLTHVEMVKSCSPLTMPLGRFTYSPFPDSLRALPISPGTRGPVAEVSVTWVIVRVSAVEPEPIRTCWPTARPVALRRSMVVSPALAGDASPELARPSR